MLTDRFVHDKHRSPKIANNPSISTRRIFAVLAAFRAGRAVPLAAAVRQLRISPQDLLGGITVGDGHIVRLAVVKVRAAWLTTAEEIARLRAAMIRQEVAA